MKADLLWHRALEVLTVCVCVLPTAAPVSPSPAPVSCPLSSPLEMADLFSIPIVLLFPKHRINRSLWGVVSRIYLPSQGCRDSSVCVHCEMFPFIAVLMFFHFMVRGVQVVCIFSSGEHSCCGNSPLGVSASPGPVQVNRKRLLLVWVAGHHPSPAGPYEKGRF